jgi:hypothetical protein
MEYLKKDDTTLQVVKPVEVKEETHDYTLDFLKQQEVQITKQRDDFVVAREAELKEVNELIAQCEVLGIKSRVEIAEVAKLEEVIPGEITPKEVIK